MVARRYDVTRTSELKILVFDMTKNKDPNKESLAEIAVDPDVLARELALELEIDPL